MKIVSNSIKNALKEPTTQRKGKILVNGNYYEVFNVEYYADAYNEGNVIGNAIASQLDFDLPYIEKFDSFKYFDGVWTGNDYEYVYFGTFTVFDEKDEDEFNKHITAFDNLIKFNTIFEDKKDYPKTLFQELQNICNQAGVELENTSIANGNFIVENNQFVAGENLKTVLKNICGISGTYAVIKNDKIVLQLKNVTNEVINKSHHEPVEWKRKTYGINQVVLGLKDVGGEYVVKQDDEDIAINGVHKLVINDNYFAYTQEKRQQLINELFEQVKGFGYIPYELKGEWLNYMDIGDTITIDESETVILRINGKSPKSLESEMSAPAIIDSSIDYVDNTNTLADKQRRTELWVDKNVGEIRSEITKIDTTVENITTTKQTSRGGNNLYLEDAMESSALEYIVEGKSEQKTRSGKNLLPNNLVDGTLNGVTYKKNNDGSISLTGTASSRAEPAIFDGNIVFKKGAYINTCKYLVVGVTSDNQYIRFDPNIPTNLSSDTTFKRIIFRVEVGTTTNEIIYPQIISTSTTDTSYEPYGPSPNPDYPQEIKTVRGCNLYEGSQDWSGIWGNSKAWSTDENKYNNLIVKKTNVQWNGIYKELQVKKDKTYTFSLYAKSDSPRDVTIYLAGGTATFTPTIKSFKTDSSWQRYSLTFTAKSSGTIRPRLENVSSNTSVYTYVCGYQLNEGNEKQYVPYGHIAVRTIQNILTSDFEIGSIQSANGLNLSSNTRIRTIDYSEVLSNTQYKFEVEGAINKYALFEYDVNKTFIKQSGWQDPNTILTTSNTTKYIRLIAQNNGNVMTLDNLNKFNVFEPYKEAISYIDLKGNELCKIDNVQDELDITNGKFIQRIGKVVLNGSENWAKAEKGYLISNFPLDREKTIYDGYCSHFMVNKNYIAWQNIYYCGWSTGNTFWIRDDYTLANNLESWKTWLSNNPVTVYYVLAEPQTIELGDFPIMLYNDINNVELISELDTTTQITYLRNTPISDTYATNQRVDKTDSNLDSTNDSLNQTKQDVESTAIDLHNNYYDKEQINSIITTTEEEITTLKQTVETNTSSTNLQISVIEEQLKNGITAVKTETGYTFDKNGLNISKTGSEMSSTLDNDGLSVKRDNTEVLTVRSAGVETENLKVRTYFTIGSHTRVEDYGNGTGFFHIGGV